MELNLGLAFSVHIGTTAYGFNRPILASELAEKATLAAYGFGDNYAKIQATCALVHAEMQKACVDPIGHDIDWNHFLELYQQQQFPAGLLSAVLMGFGIKVSEDIREASHNYLRQKVADYQDHAAHPFDVQRSFAEDGSITLREETRRCRSAVAALKVLPELLEGVSEAPLNGTGDVIHELREFYASRLEEIEPLFGITHKDGFRKALNKFHHDLRAIELDCWAYQTEPLPATLLTREESASIIRDLRTEVEVLNRDETLKKVGDLRKFVETNPDLEPVRAKLESLIDALEALIFPIAALQERIEALSRPQASFTFAEQPRCPELHHLKPAGFPSTVAGTPKAKLIGEKRDSSTMYRVACYPELFYMDELLFIEIYKPELLRASKDYFFSRAQFNQTALKQEAHAYEIAANTGDSEKLAQVRMRACASIVQTERFILYRKRIADREAQKPFFAIAGKNYTFVEWCFYWIHSEEDSYGIERGKSVAEAKFPEGLTEEQRDYMAAMMFFPTIIDYHMRHGRIDQVTNAMEFFGFEHSTGRGPSKTEQKLAEDIMMKPATRANFEHVKNARILVVDNKAHMVINLSDPITDIITGEDIDTTGRPHQWIKLSDLEPEAQGWYGELITRLHNLGTIGCQASRFVAYLVEKGDTYPYHWMWRDIIGIIMSTPDPKKALTFISKWMVSNHEALLFFDQLRPFVFRKPYNPK